MRDRSDKGSSRALLPLPLPHYTAADAWAALGSRVREQARDYLRAERLPLRFVLDGAFIGRLEGFQAERIPTMLPAAGGYLVSCSCGRRQPCAHVGALAMAYAEHPESFEPFVIRASDARTALMGWAAGEDFPWDAMKRRAEERLSPQGPLAAVQAAAARERLDALWEWAQSCDPALLLDDAVQEDWLRALTRAAAPPLTPHEAAAWLGILDRQPEIPLTPLLRAVRPEAALEPVFLSRLYRLEADALWRAKPSVTLSARTVALLFADWLFDHGRAREVRRMFGRFRVLSVSAIPLGDWLYTHGRQQDARVLWENLEPRNQEQARVRSERLKLPFGIKAPKLPTLPAVEDAPPDPYQE